MIISSEVHFLCLFMLSCRSNRSPKTIRNKKIKSPPFNCGTGLPHVTGHRTKTKDHHLTAMATKDASIETDLPTKCCNKPGWTALLLVSLLNGLILCTLQGIYHNRHHASLIHRVSTLESSLTIVASRLLEMEHTGRFVPTNGRIRQTVNRYKRSSEVSNSTSAVLDAARDLGAALLTTLGTLCKSQGGLCVPGPKGTAGLKGEPGTKGEAGLNGSSGNPGLNGTEGSKGAKGGLGQTGRTGRPGVKGEPGASGLRGEVGAPGEQGIQGLRGDQGEPGPKGRKGEQGSKGDQGTKGEKGQRGVIREPDSRQDSQIVRNVNSTAAVAQEDVESVGTPTHQSCNSKRYAVLKDDWRRESVLYEQTCVPRYSVFEDGWYRFGENLGGMIKTHCPPSQRCRAVAPGWMQGGHPTEVGVAVSRTVCFSYDEHCCSRSVPIEVVNCTGYYVYHLPEIPTCYYEYCGNAY